MKLLAIDTSTEACSAALSIDGEISEHYEIAPRKHAELILPMIDKLLVDAGCTLAQMDAIAFGRGPGAFTGVRIGTGVVQGLAFSIDCPVVPVSSLAAMAYGVMAEYKADNVLAGIDARMAEVYWGAYQRSANGGVQLLDEESVCKPDETFIPVSGSWIGAGTAWQTYGDELAARYN
ncbi:tRNA threonylcarbamoyladenosine biosynthesis protein TsaB, partial [hydrothermal vent metagenome]